MRKAVKFIIGILFLLAGAAIFLYPNYQEWKTEKEIARIMESIQRTYRYEENTQESNEIINKSGTVEKQSEFIAETVQTENDSDHKSAEFLEALHDYNQNLFLNGQDIEDAWSFRQTTIDMENLNGGSSTIGCIEIPDIDLTLPLLIGATETNMSSGAVVLAQTSMPVGGENTNCVIAAHRGWSGSAYFRDIDQLVTGSKVIIQNPWETLVYQVTGTEVVHATESDILRIQPGKDLVTLFSCYPYMDIGTKYRLVINCERVTDEDKETDDETFIKNRKVKDLAEESMDKKGIVIEEGFTEELSEQEDMLRSIIPAVIILGFAFYEVKRISDTRKQ